MELPPAGLVSHWLNLAAEFLSLTQGLFFSSQSYIYLLLSALRHICRLCQEILHADSRAQAVSIHLRIENAQHWPGKFSVFESRAPIHPLEQATKLTNICKVESVQQAFLGCLLFQDSIILCHTSSGFLWSCDSTLGATWNCPPN